MSTDIQATNVWLFWTFSPEAMGPVIARTTDGPWSHMGLGVRLKTAERVYYEALFGKGVTGPKSIGRLRGWVSEKPGRKLCIRETDIMGKDAEIIRQNADDMVGTATYAEWQLAAMLLFERYGIPVPHSPNALVCCEMVSRLIQKHIDLRDRRRKTHDEVNPNSAWRRVLEIELGLDEYNAPPVLAT